MWVLCAYVCGQVQAGVAQMVSGYIGGAQGHAGSSRHPSTVKGQGGASCGLGLDDVAVRDLQRLRHAHVHVRLPSERSSNLNHGQTPLFIT